MADYLDKIRKYLDEEGVEHEFLHHPVAYTAQQVAGAQHVPGRQMIKSVIVRAGDRYVMCLLPAIHLLDFDQLKELLAESEVRLAREDEVANLFPDCAVGAEPPFGNWYDLEVFADSALEDCRDIVFNAGTHTDTVRMAWQDFKRLVQPSLMECWVHI